MALHLTPEELDYIEGLDDEGKGPRPMACFRAVALEQASLRHAFPGVARRSVASPTSTG